MLEIDSLTDVPKPNELNFGTLAWMKSDSDRRSELYTFCQAFVDKHVDFSYSTVGERSKNDITNYADDVISLGLFYFNYKGAV